MIRESLVSARREETGGCIALLCGITALSSSQEARHSRSPWPQLSAPEMADLMAFLQGLGEGKE
jgi:hypothetical protein